MDDIVAGRYRLEDRIGSGGMAEVWRAVDTRTGSMVAIKRLHPGVAADPAARARFRREIEAAEAVAHPAAVRILDAGPDDDSPWLVMEHVAGGSLADRLVPGVELPLRDVARIGAAVAGALAALHAAGLVHRDVTPSNILLALDGGARLGDFGIARTWDGSAAEDVTGTGDVVGTLRFVAPEVLAGEPAGPAADVWALGAVLYEAVTGRRPFDASSPAALLASQRRVPSMDGVEPALASLLGRMLHPDPKNRPAAAAVASVLGDLPRDDPPIDADSIPEEGTVVMATAVPSRAAAAVIEPAAIRPVAPAPGPASGVAGRAADPVQRRRAGTATPSTGAPAPAVLAVALLILAAVVLGASAFGDPTGSPAASAPPARTTGATPTPTVTTPPDGEGGNAGAAGNDKAKGEEQAKDKEKDKDRGKGNGKGNGNGNGRGNGD